LRFFGREFDGFSTISREPETEAKQEKLENKENGNTHNWAEFQICCVRTRREKSFGDSAEN
jgi:hypothetical protein